MIWTGTKRRVFVSFYSGDESEVLAFVTRWADAEGVFSPIVLHDAYSGFSVESTNAEYVMSAIRRRFLADSTVTLLLMGSCTHSRRYVDWELKASLRQGQDALPNGVLAINLPVRSTALHLPDRFKDNWDQHSTGSRYARWYPPATDRYQLGSWIDDAFTARRTRAALIQNGRETMANNSKCRACGITHPAR